MPVDNLWISVHTFVHTFCEKYVLICADMCRYVQRCAIPQSVEISSKKPATVEIAGLLFWRRAWDSNPQVKCRNALKFQGFSSGRSYCPFKLFSKYESMV